LRSLKFLDPACGCGNFLIVSYRALRELEIETIKELLAGEKILNIDLYVRVNVDQFFGIEIEEFPVQVARTALWLMDHLMNNRASAEFGEYLVRIPLTTAAKIVHANAIPLDWETVVPKAELSYILGNPPCAGYSLMSKEQKNDIDTAFQGLNGSGMLDYVTCWYKKAAEFIKDTPIQAAFVSTNSICQGEQVPILWPELMNKHGVKINFAHQTFKWWNEARNRAAVYCVIIGFSQIERKEKDLFVYQDIKGEPSLVNAKKINAYLFDGETIFIDRRTSPLCDVPQMASGNRPADDGNLLFSDTEKNEFIAKEPKAEPYILPFLSASEFLNGKKRWCLWLVDLEPEELKAIPEVFRRVEAVKRFRLASVDESMRNLAMKPALFRETYRHKSFILVPRVSSENRQYVPMGFFDDTYIAGDTCHTIPGATLYHFGVLTSGMHMAWMRYTCGRLKSDYRYSKDIVYNNFPWPQSIDDKKQLAIEKAAQAVLDERARHPTSSMASMYDPVSMPPALAKAHQTLDKAVEKAYGKEFTNDADRVAHLFYLYQTLTEGLIAKRTRRKNL
jgi:hypothetical protein